jgi:hypothetical protein
MVFGEWFFEGRLQGRGTRNALELYNLVTFLVRQNAFLVQQIAI